jgi:hypothetical protein
MNIPIKGLPSYTFHTLVKKKTKKKQLPVWAQFKYIVI